MDNRQLLLLIVAGYGVLVLMMLATWMVDIISMIRTNNKKFKEKGKKE